VRAGNAAGRMVNVTLLENGKVMRYFPVATGSSTHVPISIVDEIRPGTEVSVSAARKTSRTLVLDIGILEVMVSG
jgi:hypothetical protein